MELVLLFVVFGFVMNVLGFLLILRGLRASKAPPIPPAQLSNLSAADAVYAKAARAAARAPRTIAKGIAVLVGMAMIIVPWIVGFVIYLFATDESGWGSKGRILRIKNRAQLPAPALGEGWSTDTVTLVTSLRASERTAIGELWLLAARMEHASVPAFSQLSLHLSALGAPARLLVATHQAALDEIRHAEHCYAVARAITGEPHTAGPIDALGSDRSPRIDLTRLAIGSLVDGCVAEGIASDVAQRGAASTTEPTIQAVLAMIARDEARHAELAWDVLAWALANGGATTHAAVTNRVELLHEQVTPALPAITDVDAAVLARFGVIEQHAIGDIARARIATVQARARRLLAECVEAPALSAA